MAKFIVSMEGGLPRVPLSGSTPNSKNEIKEFEILENAQAFVEVNKTKYHTIELQEVQDVKTRKTIIKYQNGAKE